jgi:hypothetical protein
MTFGNVFSERDREILTNAVRGRTDCVQVDCEPNLADWSFCISDDGHVFLGPQAFIDLNHWKNAAMNGRVL